ncbi:tetratricopeptide repeat protein [Nonomuraea rosea]
MELRTRLAAEGRPGPQIVVLHGLGGMGKTSLAVEYAHRHSHTYGLIWQLAAQDPTTLSAQLGELAVLLGVRDLVDAADPVTQVHAALAARADSWLLIIDNAIDAVALRTVLPPVGQGHVIVTSRSAHWPSIQGWEVSALDGDIAADFLISRTASDRDDHEAARRVAEQLGGLPLALEQAAAYLSATGRTLDDYLGLLNDQRAELLAHGDPTGYDQRVASTWSLTLDQLQHATPIAIALLRLLACYSPDDIPIGLLLTGHRQPAHHHRPLGPDQGEVVRRLAPLFDSPFVVDEAVTALGRYSLISPPVQGLTSIHRLVQAITLDHLSAEGSSNSGPGRSGLRLLEWRRVAAMLLETKIPQDPDQPASWPAYARLLPHAHATLGLGSSGMRKMLSYLEASGDYTTARTLCRQIYDATREIHGTEHPATIASRGLLAVLTGRAGDAISAREQFADLLPLVRRVSGSQHPTTLHVWTNFAHWTGLAGDAVGARDEFATLLPLQQMSGPEHPDTLTVRTELAYWTGQAGDVAGARDQFATLLPVRERVQGPEHPDTLTVRTELAYWTGQAGNRAGARDQFATLLRVRERVFGPEHPDTLTVRAHLAYFTGWAGDAVAARNQYTALLPIRERVLGPEHPDTLTVRAHLAYFTGRAGDAARARDQYAALLPIRERVLGPKHPETLATRANLAAWTEKAGNPSRIRDRHVAPPSTHEHPQTARPATADPSQPIDPPHIPASARPISSSTVSPGSSKANGRRPNRWPLAIMWSLALVLASAIAVGVIHALGSGLSLPDTAPSATASDDSTFFTGTWVGTLTRLDSGTVFPVTIPMTKAAEKGTDATTIRWGAKYHCTATLAMKKASDKELTLGLGRVRGDGCKGGVIVLSKQKDNQVSVRVTDADGSVRMSGEASR